MKCGTLDEEYLNESLNAVIPTSNPFRRFVISSQRCESTNSLIKCYSHKACLMLKRLLQLAEKWANVTFSYPKNQIFTNFALLKLASLYPKIDNIDSKHHVIHDDFTCSCTSLQDNGFPCPTMLKTTIVHDINIKELIDKIFQIENMQSAFLNVTSAYSHHYTPQINMSLAPLPNINSNEAAMTTFKLVEIEIDFRREITPILVKYSKHKRRKYKIN